MAGQRVTGHWQRTLPSLSPGLKQNFKKWNETAITNQPEESYRKNISKATWNSEILKNKSKDRDNNFLVVISYNKPKELLREEKGWLTDVDHNSWWHIKCAQHAAHNSKFEKMGSFTHPWWSHHQVNYKPTIDSWGKFSRSSKYAYTSRFVMLGTGCYYQYGLPVTSLALGQSYNASEITLENTNKQMIWKYWKWLCNHRKLISKIKCCPYFIISIYSN